MTKKLVLAVIISIFISGAFGLAYQESEPQVFRLRIIAEQANLRERPDIGSAIVQLVPEGTFLEADRKEGEWFFVRYTLEDGGVIGGYVHESLVVVVEGPAEKKARPAEIKPATEETVKIPSVRARAAGSPAAAGPASPVELSFWTGMFFLNPRDLNEGVEGVAGFNSAFWGFPYNGTVDEVRLGGAAGLEISYRANSWLALGLRISNLAAWNKSSVDIPVITIDGQSYYTLDLKPEIRILPVTLTVRFYPARDFYVHGSLGYYSVKAGYLYGLETEDGWQQWKGTVSSGCFGGEAGLGGDWRLSHRWSLFYEAGFRLGTAASLEGTERYSESGGVTLETAGTLWYFKKTGVDSSSYPLVFIRETKPAEEGVTSARPAEVNISGVSLKIGLRFRF